MPHVTPAPSLARSKAERLFWVRQLTVLVMLMLGATILTVQVKAGLIEPVGSGLTNQSPTAGSGLSVLSDNRPGNTSREAPTGQLAEV